MRSVAAPLSVEIRTIQKSDTTPTFLHIAGNGLLVAQRGSCFLKRFEWSSNDSDDGKNGSGPPAGVIRESEMSAPVCKKDVLQLAVVETHQFLVLLADDQVNVLQLPALQPVASFDEV